MYYYHILGLCDLNTNSYSSGAFHILVPVSVAQLDVLSD